jgi:hypothetical protein
MAGRRDRVAGFRFVGMHGRGNASRRDRVERRDGSHGPIGQSCRRWRTARSPVTVVLREQGLRRTPIRGWRQRQCSSASSSSAAIPNLPLLAHGRNLGPGSGRFSGRSTALYASGCESHSTGGANLADSTSSACASSGWIFVLQIGERSVAVPAYSAAWTGGRPAASASASSDFNASRLGIDTVL